MRKKEQIHKNANFRKQPGGGGKVLACTSAENASIFLLAPLGRYKYIGHE